MIDLDGKVAVVTGSTGGIGLAIAEAMAEAGASVMISSRTEKTVKAKSAELSERTAGRVAGQVCDVRDPASCARLIDGAVARFGRLDILVNNAGLGRFAPIQELSIEDWQQQIDTNLSGVFYCSKAAIPHLAREGGWIINIGSLAGKAAVGGGTAYNASKFGLMGLTEAMMLDLRYEDIRVTVLMPGTVETDFFGPREPGGKPKPENDWKLQPEDCARAVMDLLAFPTHALPSRIELRPSRPPRK